MEMSPTIGAISAALSKAQAKFRNPGKDKKASVQMKAGGSYNYDYCDLATCRDAAQVGLSENELAVTQHPATKGAEVTVDTVLSHSSGEWFRSSMTTSARDATPQSLGSAITYLRRYAYNAIIGLTPSEEDDDGARASDRSAGVAEKAQAGAPPQSSELKRKIASCLAWFEAAHGEGPLSVAARVGKKSPDEFTVSDLQKLGAMRDEHEGKAHA